jgi:hypothetical protein
MLGGLKKGPRRTPTYLWVDIRDVISGHHLVAGNPRDGPISSYGKGRAAVDSMK